MAQSANRSQIVALDREAETGDAAIHSHRHKHLTLRQQRELLPIFRYKYSILYSLEKYKTLILIGGIGFKMKIGVIPSNRYSIAHRNRLRQEHTAAVIPA